MPFQDSARAGGGEEAVRGEIDWELNWVNKENSRQPCASAFQLHQETPEGKAEGAGCSNWPPKERAQLNNWWRLIGPETKLCWKPIHPILSGFGVFCQIQEMGVGQGFWWARLIILHLGRDSGLCLLASHQLPLFPVLTYSFLFKQPLPLLLFYPPSNPALFPAQSGEVSSWILLYFLGSVWHSLVPGALACCSCNSSPAKHRRLGTRSQSSASL